MKRNNKLTIAVFTMLFALSTVFAQAGEMKIKLKPGKETKKAEGEVMINDDMGQKKIVIHMEHLRSNSVYTVWLVNEKPKMDMMGLGMGDYSFKTDDKGTGHYEATISADDLGKWKIMKIAFHPDGNAKNMKGIKIDLEGKIHAKGGEPMNPCGMKQPCGKKNPCSKNPCEMKNPCEKK